MKKRTLTLVLLGCTLLLQAQQNYTATPSSLIDSVQSAQRPVMDSCTSAHPWDFRCYRPGDEKITSTLHFDGSQIVSQEGDTRFIYDSRQDGWYLKEWSDAYKSVVFDMACKKRAQPLPTGGSYTYVYSAAGSYRSSGLVSLIDGNYEATADSTGSIILPDGRELCAAVHIHSTDTYREAGCHITEVRIHKELWYVPYYPLPVFVRTLTSYGYPGRTPDTLRSAYYTLNAMPQPQVKAMEDTTICIGAQVRVRATGRGDISWRKLSAEGAFSAFRDTVLSPRLTTSYVFMATDRQCNSIPALDTLTITVNTPPTLQLSTRDTSIYHTTALTLSAQSSYPQQWYLLQAAGEAEPLEHTTVSPDSATRYLVTTGSQGCGSLSDTLLVRVISIPEILRKTGADFIVYPNPAAAFINIIAPVSFDYYRIAETASGTIVKESTVNGDEGKIQIDLSRIQTGIYTVALRTQHGWLAQTFIKTL